MVKKLFLIGVSIPSMACANGVRPPDLPPYVEHLITYAPNTVQNVLGNGSSNSGTPPAAAQALTDPYPVTEPGWTVTGSAQPLTLANGGSAPEAKFRTLVGTPIKILFDDPERNYGAPGASHCHTFYGNYSANAYSTYALLRKNARKWSRAGGGPLNGTAYWIMCAVDGNGKVVVPWEEIIYYVVDPFESEKISPLYNGMRYVTNTNMDDPNETWLQARLDIANAQPGTAGRYTLTNGGNHGYSGDWTCAGATPSTSKVLKTAGGLDPFGGTCVSGADFWVQIVGSNCWDGRNLHSSDSVNPGYRHVYPAVWDTVYSKWVCGNGDYKFPGLTQQVHYNQNGPSDYMNWRLSSDDAMQAKLTALGTPRTILNGESIHADWFGGWNGQTLIDWQKNCIGEGILGGAGLQKQCDGSDTGNMIQLITTQAAPTGRFPQVQNVSGLRLTPSTVHNGPSTMTTTH